MKTIEQVLQEGGVDFDSPIQNKWFQSYLHKSLIKNTNIPPATYDNAIQWYRRLYLYTENPRNALEYCLRVDNFVKRVNNNK